MMRALKSAMFARMAQLLPFSALARNYHPVFNYHACYSELPPNVAPVDNITPAQLHDQLLVAKRYFEFVPIDELVDTKSNAPLASVTFDDGYVGALEYGLSVCASLNIPMTVFINTSSLTGRPFWRNKVQYIIDQRLVAECERSFQRVHRVPGLTFYQYLKHPSNSSIIVNEELDAFLASRASRLHAVPHLTDAKHITPHPLLYFGNHGHNHYVMSSLSVQEQHTEIETAARMLNQTPGIALSHVFSLPFGLPMHADRNTVRIVKDLGYKALLLNRGGWSSTRPIRIDGIPIIDRFSPVPGNFEWQLKRELARTFMFRTRGSALSLYEGRNVRAAQAVA